MRISERIVVVTAMSLLFGLPGVRAQQQAERILEDPPLLEILRKAAPELAEAPGAEAQVLAPSGEAVLDLNIVYTSSRLWNPAELRYDPVKLRSYQGTDVNPNAPYVSPTIEVVPGDTVRITLNNQLPADPSCTNHGGHPNTPHCFNGTNLHTHGLWVNPGGNGDNVLISINPGVSFQYEYKIPPDHPAGTFWYHTHRHGSTALQVSSGMAGALIVKGERVPTARANGDIDTLLRPTAEQPFTERVLVMQQIQYACRDANGKIKKNPDQSYRCDPGDVGGIEGYDQFGPGTWRQSGRYTSLNGQVLPTFGRAKAGKIERWRMIHGGVRDTINLELRKLKPGAPALGKLTSFASDAFVGANCTGEPIPLYAIAADGLTMAAAQKKDVLIFQPAYRWDSLVVFPEAGRYCVVDSAAPASANVDRVASSRQLLGFVNVAPGSAVSGDLTKYLTDKLVAAAAKNLPAAVRTKISTDLKNGLTLASFVPHPDIKDSEVTGQQELVFNIDVTKTPVEFQVNGKPYDPARVDRILRLGSVDEWTLKSDFASHPFHIHINPFQVVKILDPNGKDVSAPDATDDAGGAPDPQYQGLKGVWKDTLWVKNLIPPGSPPGQYKLIVRTRYQRYIGDFVLHCHILDHEDEGMMQNVRIALPDGLGGTLEH